MLMEASEESGSIHLPQHLTTLKERIGTPNLIVCLDSGCGNCTPRPLSISPTWIRSAFAHDLAFEFCADEQLWVTTSLRGVVVGELTASGLREGVHSGDASGSE